MGCSVTVLGGGITRQSGEGTAAPLGGSRTPLSRLRDISFSTGSCLRATFALPKALGCMDHTPDHLSSQFRRGSLFKSEISRLARIAWKSSFFTSK